MRFWGGVSTAGGAFWGKFLHFWSPDEVGSAWSRSFLCSGLSQNCSRGFWSRELSCPRAPPSDSGGAGVRAELCPACQQRSLMAD